MKSIARAVSIGEKKEEKIVKDKTKKLRIQSAKTLYDWVIPNYFFLGYFMYAILSLVTL